MSGVSITLATEREIAAGMALTPQLQGLPTEFLIARRGEALIGAAGVVWRDKREAAGFPIVVEVLEAERRRGVGRRLVDAALALVRGEGDGLWSHNALEDGSPAAAFAAATGFSPQKRVLYFQAEVARVTDYVKPMIARLRARGHVPEGARIVPLGEAPPQEVGWLVSAAFGGGPGGAAAYLRSTPMVEPDHSLAVMDGDEVAGVVLGRVDPQRGPTVEVATVAPRWRQGWANAVLTEAIADLGLRAGASQFRFHCDEDVLATMQLAARIEAVRERTAALYYQAA